MIDFYTWSTPNGRKISIALEEFEFEYRAIDINIGQGEQHSEAFLEISPNNKIPAIVDHDSGVSLMESGAILMYLADKAGRLWPEDSNQRYKALEWLMWQMGSLGPMLGQAHHFLRNNPGKSEYAEKRYRDEANRLYRVLDTRLAGREYIVDDYSIVDIACWPWISRFEWHQVNMHDYPNVLRWYREVASRPAVIRGYPVGGNGGEIPFP